MIHLIRAQTQVSIENNAPKVTRSLGIISHSVDKLALKSFSAKIKLRVNKAQDY